MATIGSLSESNRGENVDKNVKEHLMDIDSRYRPDGWEQRMKGPRTIESLCEPWDGTKVWAVLDKVEGMWRQATVLAVVPDKDDPQAEWSFVLDTKHDSWRHIIKSAPQDNTNLDFDLIQVTEFIDLPGAAKKRITRDGFDLLPPDSEEISIKSGKVAIHPYVASELRALRLLVDQLRVENDTLKRENTALKTECAERKRNEERLAALLAKEQEEHRKCEERLVIANAEIQRLKRALLDLEMQLMEQINNLKAEVENLNKKVSYLTDELTKARQTIDKLTLENVELMATVVALEQSIQALLKRIAEQEAELKNLRDLLAARDVAMQKMMDAHARTLQEKMSEIERLLSVVRKAQETQVIDATSMAVIDQERLAALEKEKQDFSELMAQAYAEIKELRYRITIFEAFNLDELRKELERLTGRVVKLENVRNMIARPFEERKEPDDDTHLLDEEKDRKRMERKALRDRVRQAQRLAEEIIHVRHRIEELEKNNNLAPRDKYPEDPVFKPPEGCCGNLYTIVLRSELQTLRLGNIFLHAENDKLKNRLASPTASKDDMEKMTAQVKNLLIRLDEINKLYASGPRKPKYVPTLTRCTRYLFGHPYDGNYPWLMTQTVHDLERENVQLKERMALARNVHGNLDEQLDVFVRPVVTENDQLRLRIQDYKSKMDTLQAQIDKIKSTHDASWLPGW